MLVYTVGCFAVGCFAIGYFGVRLALRAVDAAEDWYWLRKARKRMCCKHGYALYCWRGCMGDGRAVKAPKATPSAPK